MVRHSVFNQARFFVFAVLYRQSRKTLRLFNKKGVARRFPANISYLLLTAEESSGMVVVSMGGCSSYDSVLKIAE